MGDESRALVVKYASVASALLFVAGGYATAVLAGQEQIFAQTPGPVDVPGVMDNLQEEVFNALVRLPIAAGLGTVLALRPRRRGTPVRQPAVVQTQIILAAVGALIMLVVGASLARAFGIVGAANLIRYRSKIDDPKDAVVMLCALSVGLAAGVGLYGLSLFGTMFLVLALWIIEGFEEQTRVFEVTIKLGDQTKELQPRIEAILRRFKAKWCISSRHRARSKLIASRARSRNWRRTPKPRSSGMRRPRRRLPKLIRRHAQHSAAVPRPRK
jgi:uncharacterized membrane protein YhiD involved in acid resistance